MLAVVPVMNADAPGFPRIGDVVAGYYRLESVVSTERAGVTFRATHVAFGRNVMVKVASAEILDVAGGADRLLRATRVMTDLESDHVVHMVEGGLLEGGGAYLVLPWLDGCTVADLLVAGSFPMEIAVDYVLQACEALAEMHGRGIVHRDLRPDSLFLYREANGSAYVKLLCCGTAKVGADGGGIPQHTTHSAAYASPEQMADPRGVDERADVWALGVILFELLTRALPFGDGSVKEVLSAILMEPRPNASDRDARLPTALDDVLTSCMRQRRAERIPNVVRLAEALVPFGGPGAAAAAARIGEIAKAARLRPRAVLAVGASESAEEAAAASGSNHVSSAPESMAPTATTVRPAADRDRGARTVRTVARARRRTIHVSAALVFAASMAAALVAIGPGRTASVPATQAPSDLGAPPDSEPALPIAASTPAPADSDANGVHGDVAVPALPLPITATHVSAPPRSYVTTAKPKSAPPQTRSTPASHVTSAPRHATPRLSTTVFPETTPEEAFADRK